MPRKKTHKPPRRSADSVLDQVLDSWRVNNTINLLLIDAIPAHGFASVPLASRGRTVAQQLAHMHKVRVGWLRFQDALGAKDLRLFGRGSSPTRSKLKAAFRASGKVFADFLASVLADGERIKMFRGCPLDDLPGLARLAPSRTDRPRPKAGRHAPARPTSLSRVPGRRLQQGAQRRAGEIQGQGNGFHAGQSEN